jgi:zinc protease
MLKKYCVTVSYLALCSAACIFALGLATTVEAQKSATTLPISINVTPSLSNALPKGMVRGASIEGVTEYRLQNGLKVLLFPDSSKPTITVNMTYLVGSRHENYGETGMAHLLEHLLFKGSPKNPSIDKEFNARGMRSNGTTWLDRTNYFELFQANEDNLKWALSMEADRMVNSFIAKKDLDTEMTVVRNEYEQGENAPFSVLLKRMQSVAFDWHNYGNATIGNRSDIENVKIENLQAFYRRYYQPDNAVLLVAGKFDEFKTLTLIHKTFSGIPKPKRELPKLWTIEPAQDGERSFIVRRKGDEKIVALGYKVPSGLHSDADAIGLFDAILGDTPNGRLHKALVETGKATGVQVFTLLGVDAGLHLIGAMVKKDDPVEPVQAELTRIVEEFEKSPATKEEIERAVRKISNQYETTLNDHENLGVQMSEYIALGDWRLFFYSRDQLEKVTLERIAAAAKKYYTRDNRVVGMFIPEDTPLRVEMPAAPKVADMLKDYAPKTTVSVAEAFDPSPENIIKRSNLSKIGGLKVAMLAKKNRGETVNVRFNFNFGDEQSLFNKSTIAGFAAEMVTRGTSKFSRAQLADEMEKLKITGGFSASGAYFETKRTHLHDAIRLLAHVLREANFPQSEFEQLKKQSIAGIESGLSEPNARGNEALATHFNTYAKGDWRYSQTMAEALADVAATQLVDVALFHRTYMGAGSGEIAIVGDFDETKTVQVITEAFKDWQSLISYKRIESKHEEIAAANLIVDTPDKENGVFLARININMRDDDPDFAALSLANYIIGGGAGLNSRLAERIRMKEGLSYGVGSQLDVGSVDRAAAWSVNAIAAPQNLVKVEAAFKEEMAKALKDGFTFSEVVAAKSGMLQQRAQRRAQDGALAGTWTALLHTDRNFQFSKQLDEKYLALTPADLLAALRRHIDVTKITIIKAGDRKKGGF